MRSVASYNTIGFSHPLAPFALVGAQNALRPIPIFRNGIIRPIRSPHSGPMRPRASYSEPFNFVEADYHKAALQVVQSQGASMHGFMLFQRENEEGHIEDPDRGLIVAIGGDTFNAISLLLQGGPTSARPLTVDLLWSTLERGKEISKRDWTVVRVAITGLADSTFLGRIFFGDRLTGQVAWDVDCRPSDATWLAIKSGAPIYIHQSVWDTVSAPLEELRTQAQWQMARVQRDLKAMREGESVDLEQSTSLERLDVATVMTTVWRTDPEPLKLLKMELRVALAEEDYNAAARIRDHPFMRLHLAAVTARREGDIESKSSVLYCVMLIY